MVLIEDMNKLPILRRRDNCYKKDPNKFYSSLSMSNMML